MNEEIFRYPKTRHERGESPPQFTRYEPYKPYLLREFYRTCVFCRVPDGLEGSRSFTVEHYLPKKQHPELECTYSNLFYACATCNTLKGNWPYVRRGRAWIRVPGIVPNPCDHVMASHLWMDASTLQVTSRSKEGYFTLDLLELNERAVTRRLSRELYRRLVENRARIKGRIKALRRRAGDGGAEGSRALHLIGALQDAMRSAEFDFEKAFGVPH